MENVSSINSLDKCVPKLRFPEFSEEWRTVRLGDIGTFTKGAPLSKADISDSGTPFILYGELYTTYNEVTYEIKRKTDKEVAEIYYSKVGDVIIPTSGETPEEIATSTCVMLPNVILAGDLNIYRTSVVDGRIISFIINHIINDKIAKVAQGKSVVHVKADEIAKIEIHYPSAEEQNKILLFLELLDKRIDKQKQLIENLKSYKRGVLSAVFNRKIRFKGKNGSEFPDWKKVTIGSVFAERCERANGNKELLAVTINSGVIKRNEIEFKDNSSDDKSNYKRVHIDDIAYNTMRMWQGASGVSDYTGIVSPAYTVIYPKNCDTTCMRFWGYYFKTHELISIFKRFSQGLTSDTWNLKYPQLADIEVFVPCIAEQTVIADFFAEIEDMILAYEKFLEKLSIQRNELLRRMFI